MDSVLLLQHLHVLVDGSEEVKIIGVYASRTDAQAAIARLITQPGFRNFPDLLDPLVDEERSGFCIDEYVIGQDHWTKGFVSTD